MHGVRVVYFTRHGYDASSSERNREVAPVTSGIKLREVEEMTPDALTTEYSATADSQPKAGSLPRAEKGLLRHDRLRRRHFMREHRTMCFRLDA